MRTRSVGPALLVGLALAATACVGGSRSPNLSHPGARAGDRSDVLSRKSNRYAFPARFGGGLFLAAHGSWHTVPGSSSARSTAWKRRGPAFTRALFLIIWHRPTFEGPCGRTIIGAGGLNCRVRDGNGCDPAAMSARNWIPNRDGEPWLEPIAVGNSGTRNGEAILGPKLHREELPGVAHESIRS